MNNRKNIFPHKNTLTIHKGARTTHGQGIRQVANSPVTNDIVHENRLSRTYREPNGSLVQRLNASSITGVQTAKSGIRQNLQSSNLISSANRQHGLAMPNPQITSYNSQISMQSPQPIMSGNGFHQIHKGEKRQIPLTLNSSNSLKNKNKNNIKLIL